MAECTQAATLVSAHGRQAEATAILQEAIARMAITHPAVQATVHLVHAPQTITTSTTTPVHSTTTLSVHARSAARLVATAAVSEVAVSEADAQAAHLEAAVATSVEEDAKGAKAVKI